MKRPRKITETGEYETRDRRTAVVERQGTDGRWYGHISGSYTETWWHADGKHNFLVRHDICQYVRSYPCDD